MIFQLKTFFQKSDLQIFVYLSDFPKNPEPRNDGNTRSSFHDNSAASKQGEFDISRILRVDDFSQMGLFLSTGPLEVSIAQKVSLATSVSTWWFFMLFNGVFFDWIPCIPQEVSH